MVENTKTCPFCQSQIPAAATVCANCGRDVDKLGITSGVFKNIGQILIIIGFMAACLLLMILGFAALKGG